MTKKSIVPLMAYGLVTLSSAMFCGIKANEQVKDRQNHALDAMVREANYFVTPDQVPQTVESLTAAYKREQRPCEFLTTVAGSLAGAGVALGVIWAGGAIVQNGRRPTRRHSPA